MDLPLYIYSIKLKSIRPHLSPTTDPLTLGERVSGAKNRISTFWLFWGVYLLLFKTYLLLFKTYPHLFGGLPTLLTYLF